MARSLLDKEGLVVETKMDGSLFKVETTPRPSTWTIDNPDRFIVLTQHTANLFHHIHVS